MIHNFLLIVLGILSVMSLLCLLRLVLGPAAADRLLAVNMLGGMVISAIAVLSLLLKEAYLLDISFIYALISFLAVVVLAQIYIGTSRVRDRHPDGNGAGKDGKAVENRKPTEDGKPAEDGKPVEDTEPAADDSAAVKYSREMKDSQEGGTVE